MGDWSLVAMQPLQTYDTFNPAFQLGLLSSYMHHSELDKICLNHDFHLLFSRTIRLERSPDRESGLSYSAKQCRKAFATKPLINARIAFEITLGIVSKLGFSTPKSRCQHFIQSFHLKKCVIMQKGGSKVFWQDKLILLKFLYIHFFFNPQVSFLENFAVNFLVGKMKCFQEISNCIRQIAVS